MDPKNITEKKERILYIDRDYPVDTTGYKAFFYIAGALKKEYELATYKDLDGGVIDLVRLELSKRKFSALITHVPHSRSSPSSYDLPFFRGTIETESAYRESLNIIRQIKMINDIPIIAYTGAGNSSAVYGVFMEEGGVDCIVHKTLNFKDDFREIQDVLENLLRKYKQIPFDIPKPVLRTENGYTVTEVRVNLSEGVGFLSATAISKECHSRPGSIFFRKLEEAEGKEPCDGENILELMSIASREGTKIIILVKGEDGNAKSKALRLYSAFSSRYSFAVDFERFIE